MWTKKQITIKTNKGNFRINAHVLGGLAVHKRIDDGGKQYGHHYRITHIASGATMTAHREMDCLAGAKACCEHISTLIDWSLSQDELLTKHRSTLKTIPREIDRFRDWKLRAIFRL